jgi:hypothetical protein
MNANMKEINYELNRREKEIIRLQMVIDRANKIAQTDLQNLTCIHVHMVLNAALQS